jgi:opacity protein-like surface antigen
MKKGIGLVSMLASLSLFAGTMGETGSLYPWFGSIGAGYSWTNEPGIINPDPAFWDFSNEGYDSPLGDRGFYTFAIGKQIHEYIDLSLSYLNHEVFNYQKFQTGGGGTAGFTGNTRTRYFQLQNRALLVNGFLHPAHYLYNPAALELTPYIGGGIGFANNQARDFHTVGTIIVGGIAIGSTSSIGEDNNKNSFAWQGTVGLNIRPQQSHVSANIGYRYFDGGKFEGPSAVFTNSDGILASRPWSGCLEANQLFVEFQYTV